MIKVRAHTCYLGNTGYNSHARGFFRELSKHVDLRVRNFTWDENPEYLNEIDLSILDKITLATGEYKNADFDIEKQPFFSKWKFTTPKTPFEPDVDIVLEGMNHHYFYEDFKSKIKIAFTVWESTRLPGYFVNKLIEKFDYFWVVTEWHKKVLSEQGVPESRIFVVNEAVDPEFFPEDFDPSFADYQDGRFKFSIFGRWDFRKAIPEIIDSFLKEFKKEEPVDLILSVDNPYAVDQMKTTEERIEHYHFTDDRLKVKHFVKRSDYLKYIKNGHVLITCARAEGWNIPLIEALASGTPALYTDYGAQLEFAQGTGIPIKTEGMVSCLSGDTYNVQALTGTEVPGYYAMPDFEDLRKQMRYAYENYTALKEKALEDSEMIRNTYNWPHAVEQAMSFFNEKFNETACHEQRKDQCAIILSHVDNIVKKMRIEDLLKTLQFNGFKTIVSSHIPTDVDSNYLVIDKYNPVVPYEKSINYGRPHPTYFVDTPTARVETYFDYNHGPAALVLLKNAVDLAYGKGFEIVHVINYDYFIKDVNLLTSTHNNELKNNDFVVYQWAVNGEGKNEVSTGLFSAKTVKLKELLSDVNTLEDYFKYGTHFENFFTNLLQEKKANVRMLGKIDETKVITDAETLPIWPTIHLGKERFDYALCKDSESSDTILSFMPEVTYPIEVRLFRGKSIFKFTVQGDAHYKISDELLQSGLRIYLPSFEKYVDVNSGSKLGNCTIKNRSLVKELTKENFIKLSTETRKINVHFIEGPFVEILDSEAGEYLVEFIDTANEKVVHSVTIKNNYWTSAGRKWYTDWRIKITDLDLNEIIYEEVLDLKGQRVFICFESSSLGDNIAWIPYVEEFRKKHQCHVLVSTFYNDLFKEQYPQLEFLKRGVTAHNIMALYRIGWFSDDKNKEEFDSLKNPQDYRNQPMQKTITDILGMEFDQIRPAVMKPKKIRAIQGKYVCIGLHSTAQCKYWNYPGGWQAVVDFLKEKGYKIVLISKETGTYMGNKQPTGIIDRSGNLPLEERINDLMYADFYIGVGSGLSWLAWAVGIPVVLISGFSDPVTEFTGEGVARIFNPNVCSGCFNKEKLDAGNWKWCPLIPENEKPTREFECTKTIIPEQVIEEMKKFLK